MNDLTKACIGGAILGTTFSIGALVADLLIQRTGPRYEPFTDIADYIASLHKSA